jgi:transposase
MSTSLLYHAFRICNVKYRSTRYIGNTVIFKAEMSNAAKTCSFCHGSRVIFKGKKTRFMHLPPLGRKRCVLELVIHRLLCKDCDFLFWPKLQFMHGNRRYTRSFALTVLDLLQFATIKAVANYLHVGWDMVKEIHKLKLSRLYNKQNFSSLTHLGIDEFSTQKGHKYMTIFVDLHTGRILHATEGRSYEVVSPFLKKLARRAENLQAVAVDMSRSYVKAIEEHLPHVDIVFDHYHISALVNKAIDELRKELQADLDYQGKRYLKGSRFLLLYNYSNLTENNKKKLQVILDVNKPLFYMYNMKELLRYFWQFKTHDRAKEFLYEWCHDALTSGIRPFIRLGLTLNKYKDQILNYFKHRITNAVVEGTNNKIKTLKRQAYGYRDNEYFKLRLYHLHRSRYSFAG